MTAALACAAGVTAGATATMRAAANSKAESCNAFFIVFLRTSALDRVELGRRAYVRETHLSQTATSGEDTNLEVLRGYKFLNI